MWYSWFLQVTNVSLLTCRTCGLSSGCGSIRAAGLLYLRHPCVGCRERHFQGRERRGDCRPFPCGELSWSISGRRVLTSKRRPSCPAMLSPIGFQTGGNGIRPFGGQLWNACAYIYTVSALLCIIARTCVVIACTCV